MGDLSRQSLSLDPFYLWLAGQERKHELVDGQPVMMAGASRRHDRIVVNCLRALGNQLRGDWCVPFSSDTFVRIPAGNRRVPDFGVDCGAPDDSALEAAEPKLVVEVLSPTNRIFDRAEKLEEYKTVETLEYILLIDPDCPQLRLHRRDYSRTWISERIVGLQGVAEMPRLDIKLDLHDVYEGLTFLPRPRLIGPDEAPTNAL